MTIKKIVFGNISEESDGIKEELIRIFTTDLSKKIDNVLGTYGFDKLQHIDELSNGEKANVLVNALISSLVFLLTSAAGDDLEAVFDRTIKGISDIKIKCLEDTKNEK